MPRKMKDRCGEIFGELEIIAFDKKDGLTGLRWFCRCSCGNVKSIIYNSLIKGRSKSCGCTSIQRGAENRKKHGMASTKTYKSWHAMLSRSKGKKGIKYQSLGIDERWISFDNFYADMGERPDGATLDRIDNTAGYGPENCRWASAKIQQNNRSVTVFVDCGTECVPVTVYAEKSNVTPSCIRHRIRKGKLLSISMKQIEQMVVDRKGYLKPDGTFVKVE